MLQVNSSIRGYFTRSLTRVISANHKSGGILCRGKTTLLSAGEGFLGCLGTGNFEDQLISFQPVVGLPKDEKVIAIASGWAHSAAVTQAGACYIWGRPFDFKNVLRLNNMHTASRALAQLANAFSSPEEVLLAPRVVALPPPPLPPPSAGAAAAAEATRAVGVACSAGLTAVVTSDGRVLCFGQNRWGQCGTGAAAAAEGEGDEGGGGGGGAGATSGGSRGGVHIYVPTPVQGLEGQKIISVSLGLQHAVALSEDGGVWAWGKGERGQLGDGRRENSPAARPVALPGGARAAAVAAGFNHTAAISREGELFVWGKAQSTELKIDTKLGAVAVAEDQALPRRAAPRGGLPAPARALACGNFQTAVTLEDGSVWAMGLAHGSRRPLTEPVPATPPPQEPGGEEEKGGRRGGPWAGWGPLRGGAHDLTLFRRRLGAAPEVPFQGLPAAMVLRLHERGAAFEPFLAPSWRPDPPSSAEGEEGEPPVAAAAAAAAAASGLEAAGRGVGEVGEGGRSPLSSYSGGT